MRESPTSTFYQVQDHRKKLAKFHNKYYYYILYVYGIWYTIYGIPYTTKYYNNLEKLYGMMMMQTTSPKAPIFFPPPFELLDLSNP